MDTKQKYADIDSLIVNIKSEDVCEYLPKDAEKRFDAPKYEVDRPLPIDKNKNITGKMKDHCMEKL